MGNNGNFKDLTGKNFGNWTIIKLEERGHNGVLWKLLCQCGSTKIVKSSGLKRSKRCHSCMRTGKRAQKSVITQYKLNARKGNREWGLSDAQFLELSQMPCHYCYSPPMKEKKASYDTFTYNGVDRKDNSIGYTPENSLPCCYKCNMRKGTVGYAEFLVWIERLTSRNTPEYGMSAC